MKLMKLTSITTAAAIGALAFATCFAQTTSPPSSTTNPNSASNPDSASSPSQRASTHVPATESPADPQSNPSDASTPHQRHAMAKPQTMKECMDAQAAKNSAMSQSDRMKVCNEQMKMHKNHANPSKAPAATDEPQASPPK